MVLVCTSFLHFDKINMEHGRFAEKGFIIPYMFTFYVKIGLVRLIFNIVG